VLGALETGVKKGFEEAYSRVIWEKNRDLGSLESRMPVSKTEKGGSGLKVVSPGRSKRTRSVVAV